MAALCEPAARVLVVQATGWGKSAVYWAATAVRRSEGAGPDAGGLAAAVADARPGRRRRTGRADRGHPELLQHRRVVRGRGGAARRRARRAAGLARSGWPTRASGAGCSTGSPAGSGCWSSTRPTPSPTGATTSAPTTAGSPTSCSGSTPRPRCWPPPRRPTSGSPTTSPSSSAGPPRWCCAASSPGPAWSCRWWTGSPRWSATPGWSTTCPGCAGSGIVYALTVADAERLAAAVTRRARGRRAGRGLHRPARGRPRATTSRTPCATTGSRRWSPPRRSAWATTSPTSASWSTSGRRRPRSPTTSRSVVPGGAIDHAHAVLLPSDADSGVWEYFATSTIPVPEQVRAVLDVLDRSPGEAVERGRGRGAVRRAPRPGRADAQAARRRRGRRPGRGRLARHRPGVDATTPSTTTAWWRSVAARPTSCAPTSAASAA